MKKTFFCSCFLLISIMVHAQYRNNMAVGLTIGEPLGLNIRKYFEAGTRSFDINMGTYGFIYGSRVVYFNKTIYEQGGAMIQGIYNYQTVLGNNLYAYYGFGGQVNSRKIPAEIGSRNAKNQLSIGPTVNVGLEYPIPNTQLGVFINAGMYVELLPHIILTHPQINGGVRLAINP